MASQSVNEDKARELLIQEINKLKADLNKKAGTRVYQYPLRDGLSLKRLSDIRDDIEARIAITVASNNDESERNELINEIIKFGSEIGKKVDPGVFRNLTVDQLKVIRDGIVKK